MTDYELLETRLMRGNARYSFNAEFKEEDHPRGEDGKFGTGGKSVEEKGKSNKKELLKKAIEKNPKLQRWGIREESIDDEGNYIIYHGTNEEGYKKILSEGLKAPESPKFYTTTTDEKVAKEFAKGYSGDKVIKFAIPLEDITNVLWKGGETSVYQEGGKTDTQHALKTGFLDKKYIVSGKSNSSPVRVYRAPR